MEWRAIFQEPSHEVSETGLVRRRWDGAGRGGRQFKKGRLLAIRLDGYGYRVVTINGRPYRVHRLMCEAFVGPPPFEGAVARHLNDVKTDNEISNLAWGTNADNHADAVRNGTARYRPRSFDRKVAREMRAAGLSYVAIGKALGVSGKSVFVALK